MGYINFLGTIGNVGNAEIAVSILKQLAGLDEVDLDYVNTYHENVSGSKRYLTGDLKDLNFSDEKTNSRMAQYLWVDTGYKTNDAWKQTIYASFYKSPLGWNGTYIGTEYKLTKYVGEYRYKKVTTNFENTEEEVEEQTQRDPLIDTENVMFGSYYNDEQTAGSEEHKEIAQALNNNKFCLALYSKLLIKENWAVPKGNRNRLIKYIDTIATRVQRELKNNTNKWYRLNNSNTAVVINSGLLDTFMNDIFILFDVNVDNTFSKPRVVDSKTDLLKIGFSKDAIKIMPEPVIFYKDISELVFNADIEDFNIDNRANLTHIINDRRSRFPEKLRDIGADILCDKLKASINNAVNISKRDYRYVIPMYNIKNDNIQYLIPLYINNSIIDEPELVLVVANLNGFFEVMTILVPDDAYDNARLLSMQGNSWLKPKER